MFKKILIANRGEIACRIIETCHRLNIQCVAVYSDEDQKAQHVLQADEAYWIGAAPPRESYLRIDRILEVALKHGVEAIHPGYGFLSENSIFAEQCHKNGIVFIGPSKEAIDSMGSKGEAKRIMLEADVPVVPGYHGLEQDPEFLHSEAQKIGYPIMIKAVAGGGGKGMRQVLRHEDFPELLEAVQRESQAAFGDDVVLLEKFIQSPRHIEFQIFGDHAGNVVHLNERECSIQRRHQKVLEETPSPFLNDDLRQKMGDAAIAAAQAISYVGAGTVEFIVGADQQFFFMEMNTRLQVEHPVTEMTTGVDLVEWQLRVANREPLPRTQAEIGQEGHSIEVRVYAENPNNHFLPSTGLLAQWSPPEESQIIRVDTGIAQGDTVGIHYDPMLAKLIVWGKDRTHAIHCMHQALSQTIVMGFQTNVAFLRAIVQHPDFAEGQCDTSFIDAQLDSLLKPQSEPPEIAVWCAATWMLYHREVERDVLSKQSADPHSPWRSSGHWRLNMDETETLTFETPDGQTQAVKVQGGWQGYKIFHDAQRISTEVVQISGNQVTLRFGEEQHSVIIHQNESQLTVLLEDQQYTFNWVNPHSFEEDSGDSTDRVIAPMPGRIIRMMVASGDTVTQGQTLLILEAMKMEQPLQAPHDGVIDQVNFQENDVVDADATLITFLTESSE